MSKYSDLNIIYINSEKSSFSGKRESMEKKLTSLGLPYQRLGIPEQEGLSTINIVNAAHRDATKLAVEKDLFPILTLEDDVELLYEFPFELEINKDAKLIYLGLSSYNAGHGKLELKRHNEDYYRVKNSLSAHAIIIPNKDSAKFYIDIMNRAIQKNNWNDKELAFESHKELFLTPKNGPIFFQTDAHTRPITNIKIEDYISN
jgi:hypothetical protein